MPPDIDFHLLNSHIHDHGIVINGTIYHENYSATDAFIEKNSNTIPLRQQCTVEDLVRVEETLIAPDIKEFMQEVIDNKFQSFLTEGNTNLQNLLIFQCLHDVLPKLEEFDTRVNDVAKTELIDLRKRELLAMLEIHEVDLDAEKVSKRKIIKAIKKGFASDLPHKTQFDYDLNMYINHGGYSVTPRQCRGNLTFWRPNEEKRLFKIGKSIDVEHLCDQITAMKMDKYIRLAPNRIDPSFLDSFAAHYNKISYAHSLVEKGLHYQGCGMRFIDNKLFVYIKPMGFAMKVNIKGKEKNWIPFPDPPEVGVYLQYNDDKKAEVDENRVLINGDYKYFNFESAEGNPRSFCGPGAFKSGINTTWQDDTVTNIMHGVETLYNGMTPESLRNHADEKGRPGEGYKNPISSFEWISRREVQKRGLLERNIHQIIGNKT